MSYFYFPQAQLTANFMLPHAPLSANFILRSTQGRMIELQKYLDVSMSFSHFYILLATLIVYAFHHVLSLFAMESCDIYATFHTNDSGLLKWHAIFLRCMS